MSEHRSHKKKLLTQLAEQFQANLPVDAASKIQAFAEQYYQVSPDEELSARRLDNLYGATLSCWEFITEYDRKAPKVRVFNPDFEQHGWHCNHTVIQILFNDMPFLVDSVRMELNRRELSIHAIHNAVLNVERDGAALKGFSEAGQPESFIYLEVDRHSDAEWLKEIRQVLTEVQTVVEAAVNDYQPMRDKVRELIAEMGNNAERLGRETADEAAAFLDWLLQDRFTFLAYDELSFSGEGETFAVSRVEESELGTLKLPVSRARRRDYKDLSAEERASMLDRAPLLLAKYSARARVHRPAYMDLVVIKRFDEQGEVIGEHRFYGLYTSPVYSERPSLIPMIRSKVERTLLASGFGAQTHSGKALLTILNDLPRDELFLATDAELFDIAMGIFNLQERRKARLLMRRDRCGKFCTFLYYVPRDVFSTALRLQVQDIIGQALQADDAEFTTTFSESILARVHFVMRTDPAKIAAFDFSAVEAEVVKASRSWDDELHHALVENCGEELGNRLANDFRHAFPHSYRDHFSPGGAVYDIQRIEELSAGRPVTMSFYRMLEETRDVLRFKLFNAGEPLVLSDVIPVLENLGMCVRGEHPYELRRRDGERFWIHDFTLSYQNAETVELEEVKEVFQDAFAAIWNGQAENDEFNRLVIGANLSWREVAMLRAYARYNRQLRFGFSQPYIADTLARHLHLSKLLVALFRARFEPGRQSAKVAQRLEDSILDALDKVDSLNDDKLLRRFLELIKATLRTNYFQRDADGALKDYFSFKLNPHAIANIPLPRPMFEVFVYSARVEGVHLRGGKVARGGLRWSDRREDYRTEVLGLVKAQQVKNAVIVPVGAKGGFVAKQLPEKGSREEIQAEGIASYQTFISALLDITDNLVAGEVVPPVEVVRHDEDDPYFVVAADKGTATFSDIANAIAEERGFWLGDAFASGGSQGYDHKGMGITARGAWESVKLHFRELGLDTQSEAFSVIGIGDMAGDVFGNGMLLSEHIQLVAAFNHMHIFIDPNPDAAASYAERKRLFELPRSSWEDYNAELISAGGGVFSRAAKWIELTPQMKQRFDIRADRLSPNDLIHALLQAPVDLIWNGGIGTYVKASSESHADAGDKANDSLRIDGRQLRCKVLGEGGNLGFTQRGRIEFCAHGGKSNTDFIDNAGGVDCSDHEVNIKILLNEVVANGDMTVKQRNVLLREMTDEVAELVLQNNYSQALALSLALRHARQHMDEYQHLIHRLEGEGKLNRALEFLPDDDELQQRKADQQGFTRPELSVLISYAKAELKEKLSSSWITDDDYLARAVGTAFPSVLNERFPAQIANHRLRGEIIATQVANSMVNHMGITFVQRLQQTSGMDFASIAAAYVIARDVYDLDRLWAEVEALDNKVSADIQQLMLTNLIRLVRRAAYWFLRNTQLENNVTAVVEKFQPGVRAIGAKLPQLLIGKSHDAWLAEHRELTDAGVPEQLADYAAAADSLYSLLSVVQATEQTGQPLDCVAAIHYALAEKLELHWLDEQVRSFEATNHWQLLARDAYREDLTSHQRAITVSVLEGAEGEPDSEQLISQWLAGNEPQLVRWQRLLGEVRSSAVQDFAIFTVAVRELLELAQAH
ncbi:NAD-glutamate dehydrogenase [Marinobacterium arenosum]|uniref:NAD-glutamate dehydrogenase n=1 Tax=Marinobacterium arenosum TaxID=2862496 RepID=UPI001C98D439|nr:NAD-glutamate dehydrogenase [Marinobacterium arenosum]MBY4675388.1 NAD-glutamate dehydrogenase [Marinobacterium arenosum]